MQHLTKTEGKSFSVLGMEIVSCLVWFLKVQIERAVPFPNRTVKRFWRSEVLVENSIMMSKFFEPRWVKTQSDL